MPTTYLTYLPLIALGWTVFTFALGHFIGHRTAVRRDKRKEYNALVSPVRIELLKQVDAIDKDDFYHAKITKEQIWLIMDLLDPKSKKKLDALYNAYNSATSPEILQIELSRYGIVGYGNTTPALRAAGRILEHLPMR